MVYTQGITFYQLFYGIYFLTFNELILMKRIILSALLIMLTSTSFAKEEVEKLPPLDPSFMGTHKMVLLHKSSTIYALLMTSDKRPSNVQLLYKIENKDLALLQMVRDGQLSTIKTEPFNLQRLMRGEKMVVTADVYAGHFARDGMLAYEKIPLTFAKQLYVRELDEIKESSNQQEYDAIDLNKNYKLYIHRIQKKPSYAQLLHIDLEAGCLTRFRTSSSVPKENELLYKFLNCGTISPMYFETQDFEKK